MRRRLPLLTLFSRTINGKTGNDTQAIIILFDLVMQRTFDGLRVMEEYSRTFGENVMSARERPLNGVPDDHMTPVPTRHAAGAWRSFRNVEISRSSSHKWASRLSP